MARTVGERLKELREAKGYTKREFANLCGLSHMTIHKFENESVDGHHGRYFHRASINKIMNGLGLTLDEFMRGIIIK